MNTISYRVGSPEICFPPGSYIISKTPSDAFTDGCFALASYKRLLCMTTKSPKDARILSRSGKSADFSVQSPIRSIISTENFPEHLVLFYCVCDQEVVVVNPDVQANEEFAVKSNAISFDEKVYSVIPAGQNTIIVLCKHTIHIVDETTGKKMVSVTHQEKLSENQGLDFHTSAQLLAVPSQRCLTMISMDSMKSILSQPWEPHKGSLISFVKFFQIRKPSEEGGDDIFILTAANGNSLLRFWSLNPSTKRFALREEIVMEVSETMKTLDFDITVTPSEEYIVLSSKSSSEAVVIALDPVKFMPGKISTWKSSGPSLCCSAQLCKVCKATKYIRVELFLTIRTTEGFFQTVIEEAKIASPESTSGSNTSADLFSANGSHPGAGSGKQQRFLSVSSSLQGDCKALNAVAESNISKAIQEHLALTKKEMDAIDKELGKVQDAAGENMRFLQSRACEQMAVKLGHEFALRNQERLQLSQKEAAIASKDNQEPGVLSHSQQETIKILQTFCSTIRSTSDKKTEKVVSEQLKQRLQSVLPNRSISGDLSGMEKPSSADSSIAAIQASLSKICADIKADFEKNRCKPQEAPSTSAEMMRSLADQFIAQCSTQISKLRKDIRDTKESISLLGLSPAAVVDPNEILANCLRAGESGDWPGALSVALQASDPSVLLNFLESEQCKANMSKLTQPSAIAVADFLSLCLQLSFEIESVPSAIPSRVNYLHLFLVEWDDNLREAKKRAPNDEKSAAIFKLMSDELFRVLQALETVDPKSLSRPSRTQCTLIRKIIAQLLQ